MQKCTINSWNSGKGEEEKGRGGREREEGGISFSHTWMPGQYFDNFHGIKEIASGGRDSIFVVSTMMRGIPSVMAWKRGNATGSRREGHENMTSAANPPRHTHI
jgi:hypothetical protein